MPFFKHDGVHFQYEVKGEGMPIFFLHGLGGSIDQSFDILGSLEGYQIHAMAFRGHDQTAFDGRVERLNFESFASDLEAFIDYLKIDKFVLGGISMGAGISLNFTLRHPEKVEKLILHRPAWLNKPLPEYLKMVYEMACLIEKEGIENARKLIVKTPLFQKMKYIAPEAVEVLWEQWQHPLAGDFYPLIKHVPASVPFQDFEDLKRITCPTLVLGTDKDPIHPTQFAEVLAREIPNATYEKTAPRYVLPDEHTREVRAKIQTFLGQSH